MPGKTITWIKRVGCVMTFVIAVFFVTGGWGAAGRAQAAAAAE